jgi:hypothetical protein
MTKFSFFLKFFYYFKLSFFHFSIPLWFQEKRTSGTSFPIKILGLVYAGYSFCLFNFLEKLSSSRLSIFQRTFGICLTRESIKTIAESSPELITYSQILISKSTYKLIILWSIHS